MERQKKKPNLKISKILMIIGLIVIVAGISLMVAQIQKYNKEKADYEQKQIEKQEAIDRKYNESMAEYELAMEDYNQKMQEYEEDYEEWHDKWLNFEAGLSDMPTRPIEPTRPQKEFNFDISNGPMLPLFQIGLCGFIIFFGIIILAFGAKPYLTKFALRHTKETLDYAGDDITDVGKKVVDIGAPIINSAVDKVATPAIKKIKTAIDNQENNQIYCEHCGRKCNATDVECSNCGAKLK